MKRRSIVRALVVVAGCAALTCAVDVGASHAATTATAPAKCIVIQPIAISKTQDLDFGTILAQVGKLIVKPDGTIDDTNSTGKFKASNTVKAAQFSLTGEPGQAYSVSFENVVNLSNGTDTMNLTDFTHDTPTLASGAVTLSVGATATVVGTPSSGTYNGSFDVTVNYN